MLGLGQIIFKSNKEEDPILQKMVEAIQKRFVPNAVLLARFSNETTEQVEQLFPLLKGKYPVEGKSSAYVCKEFACQAPVTEVSKFEELISD